MQAELCQDFQQEADPRLFPLQSIRSTSGTLSKLSESNLSTRWRQSLRWNFPRRLPSSPSSMHRSADILLGQTVLPSSHQTERPIGGKSFTLGRSSSNSKSNFPAQQESASRRKGRHPRGVFGAAGVAASDFRKLSGPFGSAVSNRSYSCSQHQSLPGHAFLRKDRRHISL